MLKAYILFPQSAREVKTGRQVILSMEQPFVSKFLRVLCL